MIHYGLFIHLALHTFFFTWVGGPLCVRFAFIILIGEHCEHTVSIFVFSFFKTFVVLLSSILHLHLICLGISFFIMSC